MTFEILYGILLLASLAILSVGYAYRVKRKGRPRYERIEQQGGTKLLGKTLMEMGYWGLQPIGRLFIRAGIKPDAISWSSLALGAVAGGCMAWGRFGLAAMFLSFSALFDAVDGMVARMTNNTSEVGYVLDSHIDRYVEFFFLAGLAYFYRGNSILLGLSLAAIMGGYLVSYGTLMARFKNIELRPGTVLMRRAERVVYLLLGAALSPLSVEWTGRAYPVAVAVGLIAVMANFSAFQLLLRMMKELRLRASLRQSRVTPLVSGAKPHAQPRKRRPASGGGDRSSAARLTPQWRRSIPR